MDFGTVGAIITTYNRADLCIRAIKSALSQSVEIDEILIVDDGSDTDNKEKLIKFCEVESRCRFLLLPHSGNPGLSRDLGIRELDTEWVAFLDDDDVWQLNKTEIQLTHANRHGAQFICSNGYTDSGNPLFPNWNAIRFLNQKNLMKSNLVITSSVLARRSIFEKIGGFEKANRSISFEDYVTWLKLSTKIDLLYLPQPLVSYTLRGEDSLTLGSFAARSLDHQAAHVTFLNWLRFNGLKTPISRVALRVLANAIILDQKLSRIWRRTVS